MNKILFALFKASHRPRFYSGVRITAIRNVVSKTTKTKVHLSLIFGKPVRWLAF